MKILLLLLFVCNSEAIRLIRTSDSMNEFFSNINSKRTSYTDIQDSKLADVRCFITDINQFNKLI